MSGLQRLRAIALITGFGASVAAMAVLPSIRPNVSKFLNIPIPPRTWKIVAIILALLNLKSLPFAWHVRVWRAILYQLYLQPKSPPPSSLFEPLICSSHTSLFECDYNFHKSNSTYFADLDVARSHLVSALLRRGIRGLNQKERHPEHLTVASAAGHGDVGNDVQGSYRIALGAVSCHFRREIAPYQHYEMWTRLLCWDRKWLYLVTHFVRPGVLERPQKYTLQPWKGSKRNTDASLTDMDDEERRQKVQKAVFATSIAKYVVKKGRLTIPPEQVLRNSEWLPPRPQAELNGAAEPSSDGRPVLPPASNGILGDQWSWERIEENRFQGLKFAEMFGGLDELHEGYDGGVEGVLGKFADLLW